MNHYTKLPRLGWLLSETKLLILYNLLRGAGRIDCDKNVFVAHFIGSAEEVLCWFGSSVELVQLFSHLLQINAVPYHRSHIQALTIHFAKPDGSAFNSDSMRSMNSRLKKNFIQQFIEILDVAFSEADRKNKNS